MKTFALLLSLTATTAAHAAPVVDFSENPMGKFSNSLYPAQEKQILKQLFPKYVKDWEECPTGEKAAEVEIIQSEVLTVRGKFSSAEQEDLVVVFNSAPCPGAHAEWHSNVALVRNFKVLDARKDLLTDRFHKILDADGDGLLEAITSAGYSNQGYTGLSATTLTFKNGQIQATDYVAGPVQYDDCGLDENQEGEFAAVFFPDPRDPARTIQKNYRKACNADNKQYKHYSNGVLDKTL